MSQHQYLPVLRDNTTRSSIHHVCLLTFLYQIVLLSAESLETDVYAWNIVGA